MDPAAELAQFEAMSECALGSGTVDPAMRAKAGEVLSQMGQNRSYIGTIQNVLDHSSKDTAIVAACSCLLRLVTEQTTAFVREEPPPPPPVLLHVACPTASSSAAVNAAAATAVAAAAVSYGGGGNDGEGGVGRRRRRRRLPAWRGPSRSPVAIKGPSP